MPGFMITLLICSITMSALALLYMALTPFLAKRYSEKVRYYSWLFIVIGLIIPFRPQLSDSIIKVNVPINAAVPNIQIGDRAPFTLETLFLLLYTIFHGGRLRRRYGLQE